MGVNEEERMCFLMRVKEESEKVGLKFNLLYDPTLTSVHDYWKNHSFDYMDLCWKNDIYAF